MQKIVVPQDAVLDRVINFTVAKGLPFWIDKLCIEQREGSDEKEDAIQSMDLVYKNSIYTIGLLFIRIDARYQVDRLEGLLFGNIVETSRHGDGKYQYELTIPLREARETLNVIELILGDTWWERGWIFQEEYLSTIRMRLLIRSSQWCHLNQAKFGSTPGELELKAVEFRKAATRFCLALHRAEIQSVNRDRCKSILRRAGRYSILLAQNRYPKYVDPMSPTILRELGTRNMSNIEDILAIAANSCDYSERLNPKKLQDTGTSLSLALLTLYLLNGEILRPRSAAVAGFRGNIFQFLKQNTLPVQPPLGPEERGLTFAKHCRFAQVTLCQTGIETQGIIWRLGKLIDLRYSVQCRKLPHRLYKKVQAHSQWDTSKKHLDFLEYRSLWFLYHYATEHEYDTLAKRLKHFLEITAPAGYGEDWSAEHIMHLMAIGVARAIQNGRLRLGCVWRGRGRSSYTAIFIEDGQNMRKRSEYFAFTSWNCATERMDGAASAASCSSKYVSLEIDHNPGSSGLSKMRPKRWINGLCFFKNEETQRVLINWPRYFLELGS
jgi:hypothetical protein